MNEPPYGEIADLLQEGMVIPFLGAGVNFGNRPSGAAWTSAEKTFLPSGLELSRFLADKSSFPSKDAIDTSDLAKVSSYFAETIARERLCQRLHKVFTGDFEPCAIHTTLAQIERPLLIVTTNYDEMMEKALTRTGRPFDVVVHPTDRKDLEASVLWWRHGEPEPTAVPPNKLYIDLATTTVVYKMHGSVFGAREDWDSYVITEEDYVDFLSRMTSQTAVPAIFMRHFRTRHFLFLGYGLRDWNFRLVLKNLRSFVPSRGGDGADHADDGDEDIRSWAIQFRPSDLEKELWAARRVKIYDVDINEFTRRLGERDE